MSGSGEGWEAHLRLEVSHRDGRSVGRDTHVGPLRVLKSHHPEGSAICHHTIVHPPGGIAGGDRLRLDVQVGADAHALVTTPAANRFYRTRSATATQVVNLDVQTGGRLEWLPLEAIVHRGARVHSSLTLSLAPGAEALGWDTWVLGLPGSGEPWDEGWLTQDLRIPGLWLEAMRLDAREPRLLQAPLGWAGHSVYGCLWWASGAQEGAHRTAATEAALEQARALRVPSGVEWGITSPRPGLLVARGLARQSAALMELWRDLRGVWRQVLWGLDRVDPRVWGA